MSKPRSVFWEQLILDGQSPVRQFLNAAAEHDGIGSNAFAFLPNLRFAPTPEGGDVERIELAPLPALTAERQHELGRIVGRSLALWSWLGVSDLHWENLVLGVDAGGHISFTPLDIEMMLADLALPTETKLLPDADPEYAETSRHACGMRRVLPYLGKPIEASALLEILGAYHGTLLFLERHGRDIGKLIAALPGLREAPMRVLLRGTDEYVNAHTRELWPPLLEAEVEQLRRGDIPYFFRLYGRPGIHYYAEPTLQTFRTLPLEGDMPQLEPLLSPSRGLSSGSRKRLREEGLFTVLGAFDHPSFGGKHGNGNLELVLSKRKVILTLPSGEEIHARRDLRAFVSSVYLPCRCGEVRTPFVPRLTRCEA
ncbi:MAG TPA: hypothetical protein VFQ61_19485 [Polyangiaceae bacterium]|nr:hypothetical protein [Polyangiaceae bacterium]